MSERTHYDILEVSCTAAPDEIKASYRRLIKAWHPDLHKEDGKAGASEKTQEINQAYDVLSNKRSREDYDASIGQYRNPAFTLSDQTDNKIPRKVHQIIVSLIRHNHEKRAIKVMRDYDPGLTFEEASQRVRIIKSLFKR